MIIVKDIELYSMCEHHMLPFYGKAHVAYIPNGLITGLAKSPGWLMCTAGVCRCRKGLPTKSLIQLRKPNPLGVAVVIEASHLCMMMRGVQNKIP